jgi:hypothetical protein
MEKRFKLANMNAGHHPPIPINLRCPECHRLGAFDTLISATSRNICNGFDTPILRLGRMALQNSRKTFKKGC